MLEPQRASCSLSYRAPIRHRQAGKTQHKNDSIEHGLGGLKVHRQASHSLRGRKGGLRVQRASEDMTLDDVRQAPIPAADAPLAERQ